MSTISGVGVTSVETRDTVDCNLIVTSGSRGFTRCKCREPSQAFASSLALMSLSSQLVHTYSFVKLPLHALVLKLVLEVT